MKIITFFVLISLSAYAKEQKIVLAGGCFWCMEPPFESLDGVKSVISGYSGGKTKNPTYQQVSSGTTGHTEVVEITYDPKKIQLKTILNTYWANIDPTVNDRQFCDKGSQYRPEIFYTHKEQLLAIEASKKRAQKKLKIKKPILVQFTKLEFFYKAEEYHQDYYKKNNYRYKFYRFSCKRDARLKELWGSP